MKKRLISSLSLVLAFILILSQSVVAFAETAEKPEPVQVYLGKTTVTNYLGERQEYRQYEPPYYFPYDAYLASPYYFIAPEDNVYYIGPCDYIKTTGDASVITYPDPVYTYTYYAEVYLKKGSRADFGCACRSNPSDNYYGNEVTEFGQDVGKESYTLSISKAKSPYKYDNMSSPNYSIDFKNHKATLIKEIYKIPDTVLGQKVTKIGEYAYSSNSNATSVVVPKNVTEIDEYAFSGCVKLKTVTIKNPNCVYYKNSFFNCREDLKVKGGKPMLKGKKPTVKSLKKGVKSFKASWKKLSGISGYQLQLATNSKFTKNKKSVYIKKAKTTAKTVKKLKKNKKYYVRMRSYKTHNGKKYYSKWSKVKTVKTR